MRTPEQQQALEAAVQIYESQPVEKRKGAILLYLTKKFKLIDQGDIDAGIASVENFIAERDTQKTGPAREILPEQVPTIANALSEAIEPSQTPSASEEVGEAQTFFESIALPLLVRGWKVCPCYPKQKQVHTALVPHPLEMQSNDSAQIHAWAKAEPNANVCVYAEQVEGGLCFVDKDGATSLIEKYERETGKTFPRTLLVCSSIIEDANGTYSKGHWYFRQTPRTLTLGNIPEVKTGGLFSLRVKNFYVTSIGSIHPVTGKPYFIYDDAPVIPMPDDFLDWLLIQVVEEKPQPATQSGERRRIPRGQMHGAYMSHVGKLLGMGYTPEDAVNFTLVWAKENLVEGYDEKKVEKEVKDGARRYQQGQWNGLDLNQQPDPGSPTAQGQQGQATLSVTKMSQFEKKKITWLWPGRIPAASLSTLAGDPDNGKSLVTLYMAACVTRGLPFHGCDDPTPQGEVLILSAEDDPETTIAPRLEAAGADLDRVHLLQSVLLTDGAGKTVGEREAQLDKDILAITQMLDANPSIRLVIIDPISSFLGETAPMHKEQEVRRVLAPLVKRARASNLVVLLVAHFNKNTETKSAMDRVGGAKALVGLGRSAWTCVREPKSEELLAEGAIDQGERFLFLKLKGNLAPSKIGGLAYTIRTRDVEVSDNGRLVTEAVPHIQFLEDTTSTAQDIVIDGKKGVGRPNKSAACEEWLKEFLASKGGVDRSNAILAKGDEKNFSAMTVRRAKDVLALKEVWVGRTMYWGYKDAIFPQGEKGQRKKKNTVDLGSETSAAA